MTGKTPKLSPRRPGKTGAKNLLTGNPGNKGGLGATPSVIRDALRGSFATRVAILETIADGKLPNAEVGDRIKAIDMLAKYGLGAMKEVSVENVRDRVQATLGVIRQQVSPEQAETIFAELRPIWA